MVKQLFNTGNGILTHSFGADLELSECFHELVALHHNVLPIREIILGTRLLLTDLCRSSHIRTNVGAGFAFLFVFFSL